MFSYSFPVVKGVQAGSDYYIAMVPLNMLNKLFPPTDEFVSPEFRAQRKLNETRIPDIKNYILKNRDNYVFSALAASIDGDFRFIPVGNSETGVLEVSMDSTFLINDGQHRKAAIDAALNEDESLGNETISVVFYSDKGLARSQQMFTDLNKHAVKTSNSISELYDSRDELAVITRRVINDIPFLNEYVDKEKDNLGKFSSSLFTLNTFYTANKRILGREKCDIKFEGFVMKFWCEVADNMLPWIELKNKEISKKELREQYIATQAVIVQSIARIGGWIFSEDNDDLLDNIVRLRNINWKRNNPIWKNRVIRNNGRMINNTEAILLASIEIKKALMFPLTEIETDSESGFNK